MVDRAVRPEAGQLNLVGIPGTDPDVQDRPRLQRGKRHQGCDCPVFDLVRRPIAALHADAKRDPRLLVHIRSRLLGRQDHALRIDARAKALLRAFDSATKPRTASGARMKMAAMPK